MENKINLKQDIYDLPAISVIYNNGKQLIRYIDENNNMQQIDAKNSNIINLYKEKLKSLKKDEKLSNQNVKDLFNNIINMINEEKQKTTELKNNKDISIGYKDVKIIDFINNVNNQEINDINNTNETQILNLEEMINDKKENKKDDIQALHEYTGLNIKTLKRIRAELIREQKSEIKEKDSVMIQKNIGYNAAFTNKYMLIYLLLVTTCLLTLILAIIFKY